MKDAHNNLKSLNFIPRWWGYKTLSIGLKA